MSTTLNFEFRGQKTNGNLDEISSFLICRQETNDRFAKTLKISYIVVKERMAVWVQF